ncbi:MAG: hypothetical protein DRO10_01775 [Thermoprotei archaeon]|nr:MAG: hypothetical protein DRO10_01775 [Thermoprotei archaeon]
MIRVVIYPDGRELKYDPRKRKITVKKLLQDLGYNSLQVIVVRKKELLTEDVFIFDGEEIDIYEVTSTG